MSAPSHRHVETVTRALEQRRGVPREIVRVVCRDCGRVLAERPARRLDA